VSDENGHYGDQSDESDGNGESGRIRENDENGGSGVSDQSHFLNHWTRLIHCQTLV